MGAEDILEFQAGREAFIEGRKRDGRRTADWLLGWDQECTSAATAERLSYTPADR